MRLLLQQSIVSFTIWCDDIRMRGIDGRGLCSRVRARRAHAPAACFLPPPSSARCKIHSHRASSPSLPHHLLSTSAPTAFSPPLCPRSSILACDHSTHPCRSILSKHCGRPADPRLAECSAVAVEAFVSSITSSMSRTATCRRRRGGSVIPTLFVLTYPVCMQAYSPYFRC